MWKDPIVEEIHAVRARIARECDGDLTRIMNLLRAREAEHPEGLVHPEDLAHSRDVAAPPHKPRVAV